MLLKLKIKSFDIRPVVIFMIKVVEPWLVSSIQCGIDVCASDTMLTYVRDSQVRDGC
jgi:hypothetical protein